MASQPQKPGAPGAKGAPKPPQLPRISWFWFVIILVFNIWFVRSFFGTQEEAPVSVPYTLFKAEVARGNVEEVYGKGEAISGTFIAPVTWPKDTTATTGVTRPLGTVAPVKVKNFTTILPAFADTGLEQLLLDHNVEISAEPIVEETNPILNFLFMFGPALLIIALYILIFRRMRQGPMGGGMGMGGLGGLGKSSARRFDKETDKRVTFEDVAGIDDAEDELVEIVDFLKDPEKYTRLGGAAPKGVLLIGAPGTGKTLLARAVAGEADVPFFSMSGSEFVEMIVGVGAARVRDLFKQAREHAPSIIFIDEIDSIGRARGLTAFGGAQEQEQTLNQILAEMDGFSSATGVIVLAATNQPDILDKALLRAGRFDRRVVVNLPDRKGREAILLVHTRKVPLASDVVLAEVSASTPGLSGADLKNLVNEAALLAARRKQEQVKQVDFMDALEKVMLGPARALLLNPADRERIAYHEGGHAILGLVVPGSDPVKRVSIVPRGQALGVTYQRPEEDRYNYTDQFLKSRIVGILGGRVAEEIVYGDRTTGAENDIEQATGIARRMVTRWGMSDELGMVELAGRENPYLSGGYGAVGNKDISEHTAQQVDKEVRRIIQECHVEATRLLKEHRPQLDLLAKALLERETLDELQIQEVTQLGPAPDPKTTKTA